MYSKHFLFYLLCSTFLYFSSFFFFFFSLNGINRLLFSFWTRNVYDCMQASFYFHNPQYLISVFVFITFWHFLAPSSLFFQLNKNWIRRFSKNEYIFPMFSMEFKMYGIMFGIMFPCFMLKTVYFYSSAMSLMCNDQSYRWIIMDVLHIRQRSAL